MDLLNVTEYETIKVRFDGEFCFIQIHRPDARNCINSLLVEEFTSAVRLCEERAKVLIIEGLPDVFCWGADFDEIGSDSEIESEALVEANAAALYDLWLSLAFGSFVSIAHVRGKVNAGGVGFVAACDIVVSESRSVFSLSEMLFGLMPACVLPFLMRKIGVTKTNYMTLMTQPVSASQALNWQLVDACDDDSAALVSRHLRRLRYLPKSGLRRYKDYLRDLEPQLFEARTKAIAGNVAAFTDEENLSGIVRYLDSGRFPWEKG